MTLPTAAKVAARVSLLAIVASVAFASGPATAQQRIVGGATVSIADHPYQVRILIDTSEGTFSCGGSIRDATHVVTAAHCVVDEASSYPTMVAPANVEVGYGSADQGALTSLEVASVSVVPRFDRDAPLAFDAAVLTLSSPIDLIDPQSVPAKPIPFASETELNSAFDASLPGFATGWGATAEGGDGSQFLRGADLTLRPDAACQATYGSAYNASLMLCAGGTGNAPSGNKGPCQGDSGGPLAIDTDPSAVKGWELVGITSFGEGCGRQSKPAVFSWVQSPVLRPFLETPNPAPPPAAPASNPTIGGTLRVGSALTCTAPPVPGAAPTQYIWLVVDGAGNFSVARITSAPTLVLPASLQGAFLVCDTRYEGAGGFSYSDTPAASRVGPVLAAPSGAGTTNPPPARDKTRPRARVTTVRCPRRRCTVKVSTSDVGGLVRSLSAKVTYKLRRCRTVDGRRRCRSVTKSKRLRPTKTRGGFTIATTLARGRYTVSAVATDTSDNRSAPARKTFRVR